MIDSSNNVGGVGNLNASGTINAAWGSYGSFAAPGLAIGDVGYGFYVNAGHLFTKTGGSFFIAKNGSENALQLDSGNGNMTIIGSFTAGSVRPITLNGAAGAQTFKAEIGGWTLGLKFQAATTSTFLGGVWAAGGTDSLTSINWGAGEHATPWLTSTSVGTSINSTSTIKGVRTATTTYDFGTIAAAGAASTDVTVTGVAVGDSVTVNTTDGLPFANAGAVFLEATVTSANTVHVSGVNPTASGVSVGSRTFRVTVLSF